MGMLQLLQIAKNIALCTRSNIDIVTITKGALAVTIKNVSPPIVPRFSIGTDSVKERKSEGMPNPNEMPNTTITIIAPANELPIGTAGNSEAMVPKNNQI